MERPASVYPATTVDLLVRPHTLGLVEGRGSIRASGCGWAKCPCRRPSANPQVSDRISSHPRAKNNRGRKRDNGKHGGDPKRRNNHRDGSSCSAKGALASPKLPDKEKQIILAEGLCFIRKETGYVSRQCPRATHVKSGRPGKPPGALVHHIELELAGVDRLRDAVEFTSRNDPP